MLKILSSLLIALSLSLPTWADNIEAGKHYEVLAAPVPVRDKSKVEVVEIFWYGCIHCFNFEPAIKAWKAKQAGDVNFFAMPAIWNKPMELHAQAFYTAKALRSEKAHDALFNAMNVKKNRLKTTDAVKKVFTDAGVDGEKFDKTISSFGIMSQLNLAKSRLKAYRTQGTPEMIVNGKYRVSSSLAGSQGNMLKVVDYLVAKERALLAK